MKFLNGGTGKNDRDGSGTGDGGKNDSLGNGLG